MPMIAAKPPYTLLVFEDNYPDNPRKDRDNFGTMVCFHRRYSLGDNHNYDEPRDFLINKLLDIYSHKGTENHNFDIEKLEELRMSELISLLEQSNEIVLMPLYLYDHSDITMSTSPYSCPWDSGQVGWIYADRQAIEANYGSMTPDTVKLAKEALQSEVQVYDYYLRGEVYGFQLFEKNIEIDSCLGFIGDIRDVQDQIKEYLPEKCKGIVENLHYEYPTQNNSQHLQKGLNIVYGLEP